MAEGVGFEPTIRVHRIHALQACAFDHSATPPAVAETATRCAVGDKIASMAPALNQRSLIMTPRDRAGDPSGHRAGSREAAGDAGASSRFSDALRRFACPTGTAAYQGFRTASRMACDAPASPRHALLAENLGKPSLGVIIKDLWYRNSLTIFVHHFGSNQCHRPAWIWRGT